MVWILCIFTLFLSSCQQKPQESHYKEVIIDAGQVNAPSAPVATSMPAAGSMPSDQNNMFSWDLPQGWQQLPGDGMRLVTFHLLSDPKAIDCSIVALGGMAGGLEANLRRWMGQIGIQATDNELNTLMSSAPSTTIKSGQEGKVFDFTSVQSNAKPSDKSMIAVIVSFNEATMFVKMSGTVDTVKSNKADFLKLVNSIEPHMAPADTSSPAVTANPMGPNADPHAGLDMSAMGGLIDAPTSQNILTWAAPEGWTEEAGKHMRMVSFHEMADPKAIDCYIIALAGPAGGIEANLERWLGQLGLQSTADMVNQLSASAKSVTSKDGLEIKVYDFTSLQTQGSPTDNSMIAAMVPVDSTTVFVKMTGSIASVKQNKDNFLKLLGSIARKS